MTNNKAFGDDPCDSRRELEPALSTLLAQALIAYRIEVDNEFEGQLARSGFPGFKLPVVFWPLLRHVHDLGTPVVELLERTRSTEKHLFPMIGGVERWGYVEVRLEADGPIRRPSRAGYGSSRRLRGTSVLIPKAVCRRAKELWPPIIAATDDRWTERFGRRTDLACPAWCGRDRVPAQRPRGHEVPTRRRPGAAGRMLAGKPRVLNANQGDPR